MAILKTKKIILVEIPGNYFNKESEIQDLKWYSYRREYQHEWDNYLKVSILQNPYKKFIANYLYLRSKSKDELKPFQKIDKKKIEGKSAREVSYLIKEMKSPIWSEQSSYIALEDEKKVDEIYMMDEIIKKDRNFPLDLNFDFYDFNHRSYYNSEMKAYIEDYYSKDIRFLNCSF